MSSDFFYTTINLSQKSSKFLLNSTQPFKFTSKESPQLTLKLIEPVNNLKSCLLSSFAFHSSDLSPAFMKYNDFVEIQPGITLDIQITPEVIRTEENLKSIEPSERECYFEGEKFLKFFRIYSDKNCELECMANFTLERCHCIPYNLPRDNLTEVCTSDDVWESCENDVEKEAKLIKNFMKNCGCMPSCNSITYHVNYFPLFRIENSTETIINIKINTEGMIVLRRFQQFTIYDAISYVGGLVGLLAGISMMTIVEIFYFMTIRVATNFIRVVRG